MALIITILTAFANLALGIVSYVRKPSNASHILLTGFTFLIALWTFLNYFSISSEFEFITLFWIRSVMFVTPPLIAMLYLFLKTFPNDKINLKKKELVTLTLTTISICLINISPITYKSVSLINEVIKPEISYGIVPFGAFILWSLFSGLKDFIKREKEQKGIKKAQMRMFLLGIIITFSLIIITNFIFVVLFKEASFVVLGPLFTLILTSFIFYSMAKHKFFGIRFALGKAVAYLILSAFIYLTFYLVIFLQTSLWGSIHSPNAYISGVLITLLFIFTYKFLSEGFNSGRYLQKLYLYNPIEARDQFIKKVSSEIQLEKLLIIITSELAHTFKTKNIGAILFDPNNHKVIYELYKGTLWKKTSFSDKKRDLLNLAQYWQEGHSPLIYVEEILANSEKDGDKYKNILEKVEQIMRDNAIEVIMPLNRRVKQNGFLFLGEKGNHDAYSLEDFELLESIIGFTGVAVQNSIAHKELEGNLEVIEDFNKALQSKVTQATKDLQGKIKDLEEARRKERDMLDIMGHELRTPLSIIKVTLGMIKEKRFKSSTSKGLLKYIRRMDEALEREILLLETMISSTQIHSKRLEIHLEEVDIKEAIKDSLATLNEEAKKKGLRMKFSEPKKNIVVYSDKVRLAEVLNNFISNAIKYTESGFVEILLDKEKDSIRTSVKDTGQGIPKKEIKNLGRKFYRLNQYIDEKREKW